MGKKGKYLSQRQRRPGIFYGMAAAVLFLGWIAGAWFLKRWVPPQAEPPEKDNTPYSITGSLAEGDVQWAQATIHKGDGVHLFLTQQQITEILQALNGLTDASFEKMDVESDLSVTLHLSDRELVLCYDGERTAVMTESATKDDWSVVNSSLQAVFDPILRLGNTKQWISYMTANDLENLRKNAESVTWDYFEDFAYWEIGSGKWMIPVESKYYILAEGDRERKPDSLYLVENGNVQNRVDIRNGDVNAFLSGSGVQGKQESPVSSGFYSQEQAMLDGCVVLQDGDVRHNQNNWYAFAEAVQSGQTAAVTVIHYVREEYGTVYTRYAVSFDGELYTVEISTEERSIRCVFASMEMESQGVWPDTGSSDGYIRYTLTEGRDTGDIAIYEDKIVNPRLDKTVDIGLHLKVGEPPLISYPEEAQVASILELLKKAEYRKVPPEDYLFGVKLILTDRNDQQTVLEVDVLQGVYRYGMQCYQYGELSDLFRVLGIDRWPDAVQQEYAGYL